VYAQGRGEKGSLTWEPVPKMIDALDVVGFDTSVPDFVRY
jgi:hypothetical protein